MKKLLLLIPAFIGTIQPAFACDLCECHLSVEAKSAGPGISIGLFEQFTHFGTLQLDGKSVHDPADQKLDSSITQFLVGYQLNDKFGLQMNIPYISRSFRRADGLGGIDSATVSGLGDMSLVGQYRVWQHQAEKTNYSWNLIGGVKLPTGSSDRIKEELVESEGDPNAPKSGIHGHDLALGSGSYDIIIGTTFFGLRDRLYVKGGITYTIRSRGDFDYRYANDLHWNIKPGVYLWQSDEGTLGLQAVISSEYKGKDDLNGVTAEDTGMSAVYAGPELSYTWREKLSAELGTEFPVVSNNTSLQLVPDYRVKVAVTWRF